MMQTRRTILISDYSAPADGKTYATEQIQQAVNEAGKCSGKAVLSRGKYLVGSIFLPSNIEFHMEPGAELIGTTEESQYKVIPSRVAGIETEWPAGVLNVIGQKDVQITGEGTINGQGPFWWNKYWGTDRKGGMRKGYTEKGLRWAVDYDCTRPRNIIVMDSENIELSDFTSIQSGFWNV